MKIAQLRSRSENHANHRNSDRPFRTRAKRMLGHNVLQRVCAGTQSPADSPPKAETNLEHLRVSVKAVAHRSLAYRLDPSDFIECETCGAG